MQTMNTPKVYTDLCTIIAKKKTQSILWVVSKSKESALPKDRTGKTQTAQALLEQKPEQQYAVGIAYDLHEQLASKQLDCLYACLRDQWCQTTYVYERLERQQMLAELGFQLLQVYAQESKDMALFYFDLYDYKQVPDWLNSRFWANPEIWGKQFE